MKSGWLIISDSCTTPTDESDEVCEIHRSFGDRPGEILKRVARWHLLPLAWESWCRSSILANQTYKAIENLEFKSNANLRLQEEDPNLPKKEEGTESNE